MGKHHRRNLKIETLVLVGYSHDMVPALLKGESRLASPSINRMMTNGGWDILRCGEGRVARLIEIAAESKEMHAFVWKWAQKGQEKAVTDLTGPMPHKRRAEAIRRLMLVKEMRGLEAMPAEVRSPTPEKGLVEVRRETLARNDKGVMEMAFPDENKANCQLVFMAYKGWITEQEAVAGIKYRNDFHKIGGTLRSSGDWKERVSGSSPTGHTPGFLAAIDKRKQCDAAVREIYPKEAKGLLELLHNVAVLNMGFREIVTLGEYTLKPNATRLKMALEPVGWAYGEILAGPVAARLNSWWKALSERVRDVEP